MDSGLFSAATGMIVKALVQDVIGRNIANASVTGYKRERVVEGDFARHLTNAMTLDPELRRKSGSYVHDVITDFSEGVFKETGHPFDLAINGEGFFVVQDAQGNNYYTRDGSFQINQNGQLVTKEGLIVQGEGGASITISPEVGGSATMENLFNVSADGSVYTYSGTPLTRTLAGRIRVVAFENPQALERLGAGFYANPEGRAIEKAATGTINQGVLEAANYNIIQEMVEMMKNQQYYESAQKVVKTIDKTFGDLFSIVG